MSLIAELKRRSVVKVGAAYLVVAWLAIQAASILFPTFEAPPWALRIFVLAVFIGFPIALVMSWVFEVGGGGVKVEGNGRDDLKFYGLIGAIAALAFGWYHFGQPAVRAPEVVAADARSIAVLPFVNMSEDPANEYFSDGIAEEILNVLAKSPELRVAARTSSFSFKGQKLEIPDIARELKVRMVLEGSVRKQGERVRITAQLIDAQEGFHLWSETYDRDLKDVFAIQDEIARAIGKALQLKLGAPGAANALAAASDPDGKGVDVDAYDLYLRALGLLPRREYLEMAQAVELLERSVAKAPTFARAQATLAIAYILYAQYAPDAPTAELLDKATTAAHRALAADPQSAEAYGALGLVAGNRGFGDDATATMLFERSIALNPSFAAGHTWLGLSLRTSGRWHEAERENRIALQLDPRSLNIYTNLAWHLAAEGRFDEAAALLRRKLELAPESPTVHAEVAMMDLQAKRYADARAHLARGVKDDPAAQQLFSDLFEALESRKPKAEVAARFAAGFADSLRPEVNAYVRPNVVLVSLLALDAREEALAWVERSVAEMAKPQGGRGVMRIMLTSAAVGDLRCEPRFQAALARINVVDGLAPMMCKR
jgi:TolB-like protein/Flp pilus assembly protein TadD